MIRRRPRRADDGRYLPKDQAAWSRLVRRARQAARNARFGPELAAAARACARAVPPPGHAHRGSVFLQLVAKAGVLATTPAEMRAALAAQVEDLAEAVAAVLATPNVPARPRADLDG
ncbi:hypothetical protein [Phenylobacterium sp.]|uniref:hypothetical protein n=1 Tax=Phenylobacterium sp. TaxID=1871053 RepID=UPI00301C2223